MVRKEEQKVGEMIYLRYYMMENTRKILLQLGIIRDYSSCGEVGKDVCCPEDDMSQSYKHSNQKHVFGKDEKLTQRN